MQIDRRLLGVSAVTAPNGSVSDVDLRGLIRRLLIFDQYVLASIKLQEFSYLCRYMGYEGLRDLLQAGLIQIRCECFQMSQTGQSGMFGDPILPQLSYKFHWLDSNDRSQYIHDCLQGIHKIENLGHKDSVRLKRLIAKSIVPIPKELKLEFGSSFGKDVLQQNLLEAAMKISLARRFGSDIPRFTISIHDEGDSCYRVETDLTKKLNISIEEVHKIVEAALLAISSLSQIMLEMKAYSALNGFRDEALPLFQAKMNFLADQVSSHSREDSFQRVIEIADIPTVENAANVIDVDRLLKVRQSSELREFRGWLGTCSSATDAEIQKAVKGFSAKAGLAVSGSKGKALRFLIANGVGLIPHPAAAIAAIGLSA
jgi:hypothetical protein